MPRRLPASLTFALVLCWSLTAAAEIQLDWSAPAACPDAHMVERAIEARLEAPLDDPRLAPMRIHGEVEQDSAGFVLELSIETQSGTSHEHLVARDCALFQRLIALKVSLSAAPLQAVRSSGAAETRDLSALSLRAQALLTTTALPAPAFGAGLAVALRVRPLRLELALGYLPPRELRYPEHPSVGGTLTAWSAGLRGCVFTPWAAVELSGCAGIEALVLRGQGVGLRAPEMTDMLSAAVPLGGGVHVPFSRAWSLWVGADMLIDLVRPEFYVQNLGPLFRSPRLGARGLIGVELRLP